ncbi:putative fungistatic metabolite [Madurella mycetomatis]|uniref:Putative fungistatic metabolite n=1 Tax=Madurella mycetomatis TaxID=100816 RepID=A0A175W204_9PEZI|nr:putative fungistatic metabolite [Madurella mycetomatis]KXX77479.1 putative fungistatic metabolite [Madurella mycetomatis]
MLHSTPNLLLSLLLLSAQTLAQSATDTPSVTIHHSPGSGYVYHGCYNETTGLSGTAGNRALYDGTNLVDPGGMTVEKCWEFCRTGAGDSSGGNTAMFQYAGLEYARECWCAQSLSSLSEKLPDSACDLPCEGNTTQACGGNMRLTVYVASAAAVARVAWATGLVAVGAISLTLI